MIGYDEHFPLEQKVAEYFDDVVDAQALEQVFHVCLLDNGRILVHWSVERGSLVSQFMLHEELTLIRQRYLVYDVCDVTFQWQSQS